LGLARGWAKACSVRGDSRPGLRASPGRLQASAPDCEAERAIQAARSAPVFPGRPIWPKAMLRCR